MVEENEMLELLPSGIAKLRMLGLMHCYPSCSILFQDRSERLVLGSTREGKGCEGSSIHRSSSHYAPC